MFQFYLIFYELVGRNKQLSLIYICVIVRYDLHLMYVS